MIVTFFPTYSGQLNKANGQKSRPISMNNSYKRKSATRLILNTLSHTDVVYST